MKTGRHPKLAKQPLSVAAKAVPVIGDLRVWHIPQVPMSPFRIPVMSPEVARVILSVLWDYDKFQFENNIKPDYSNASGLEEFVMDDGEGKPGWCEWENTEGETISDLMRHLQ